LPKDEKFESIGYLRKILNSKQVLGGKHVVKERVEGRSVRLLKRNCEIALNELAPPLTNLKLNLGNGDEVVRAKDFFGKVIEQAEERRYIHVLSLTSLLPDESAHFQSHRHQGKLSAELFAEG